MVFLSGIEGFVLFVYICITVEDPVIKRRGVGVIPLTSLMLHSIVEDFTCVVDVKIKDERCSRCLCFKTHTLRLSLQFVFILFTKTPSFE